MVSVLWCIKTGPSRSNVLDPLRLQQKVRSLLQKLSRRVFLKRTVYNVHSVFPFKGIAKYFSSDTSDWYRVFGRREYIFFMVFKFLFLLTCAIQLNFFQIAKQLVFLIPNSDRLHFSKWFEFLNQCSKP